MHRSVSRSSRAAWTVALASKRLPARVMDPLLTLEELAPILKRSVATLRSDRSRAPHLLPPAKMIGRQPRYRLADVEAWIAALPPN